MRGEAQRIEPQNHSSAMSSPFTCHDQTTGENEFMTYRVRLYSQSQTVNQSTLTPQSHPTISRVHHVRPSVNGLGMQTDYATRHGSVAYKSLSSP